MNKSHYHEDYKFIPDPRRQRRGDVTLKEQRRRVAAQLDRDTRNLHNFPTILDDVPSELV